MSVYALIMPYSCWFGCAQSQPARPVPTAALLLVCGEKREGDGGPDSSVITYASFETPKTGVGNVYLLP